jgi:hypothetical protein
LDKQQRILLAKPQPYRIQFVVAEPDRALSILDEVEVQACVKRYHRGKSHVPAQNGCVAHPRRRRLFPVYIYIYINRIRPKITAALKIEGRRARDPRALRGTEGKRLTT